MRRGHDCAFQHASERLKRNRQVVLAAVRQDARHLADALDARMRDDEEIVLAAVSQNGGVLQYASERLKSEKDFVMKAVCHSTKGTSDSEDPTRLVFAYISEDFKTDREVVLAAVRRTGMALKFAPKDFQNDREIVLAAVSEDGRAFQYASQQLKEEKDFVLQAVGKNGRAFAYVSEYFKDDSEVALEAVSNRGGAVEFFGDRLKGDARVMLAALVLEKYGTHGFAFKFASDGLKEDPEFVKEALRRQPSIWFDIPKESELRKDEEIIAVRKIQQAGASPQLLQ